MSGPPAPTGAGFAQIREGLWPGAWVLLAGSLVPMPCGVRGLGMSPFDPPQLGACCGLFGRGFRVSGTGCQHFVLVLDYSKGQKTRILDSGPFF